MSKINYIKEAKLEFEFIKKIRRTLHQNPEIGFDVFKTKEYICKVINEIGYNPIEIGNNGIVINIKGKNNKTILFRADMDALKIKEETNLSFKSKNGNMHACGHDLHCASILGLLKIIKKYEKDLKNNIKVLFQPAEEILEGAKNMIENGVLNNPKVDLALMIHVMPNISKNVGDILIPNPGVISPSSDIIEIIIKGKECHGAMPHLGVDSTIIASYIIIALQALITREVSFNDKAILTFGSIASGYSSNIISKEAIIKGTLRTNNDELRIKLKSRINKIVKQISSAYNAKGKVIYKSSCPCLKCDKELIENIRVVLNNNFKKYLIDINNIDSKIGVGSEDFAYYSDKIPSCLLSISNGNSSPLHNSKVIFNEELLINGVASLLAVAYELNI